MADDDLANGLLGELANFADKLSGQRRCTQGIEDYDAVAGDHKSCVGNKAFVVGGDAWLALDVVNMFGDFLHVHFHRYRCIPGSDALLGQQKRKTKCH